MRALIVLALLASTAHADGYVGLGSELGVDAGMGMMAATIDGAVRIARAPVWLHAEAGIGGTAQWSSSGSGGFRQARAGVETRWCPKADDDLCAIIGVDAGVLHATYDGTAGNLFVQGNGMPIHVDTVRYAALPRLEGDFGRRWRARPGIEAVIDQTGVSGVNVTIGAAYRW